MHIRGGGGPGCAGEYPPQTSPCQQRAPDGGGKLDFRGLIQYYAAQVDAGSAVRRCRDGDGKRGLPYDPLASLGPSRTPACSRQVDNSPMTKRYAWYVLIILTAINF